MFFKKYTIYFSNSEEVILLKYKAKIPTIQKPKNHGYAFRGWFLDEGLEEKFEYTNMPKKDITLYPKWEKYSMDCFMEDVTSFDKASKVLKNLQNDFEDVPDFKDPVKAKKKKKRKKKK